MSNKGILALGALALTGTLLLLLARKGKAESPFTPQADDWFKMRLVNFPLEATTGWYVDFRGPAGGTIYGKGTGSPDYSSNIPNLTWVRKELPTQTTIGGKLIILDDRMIVDNVAVTLWGFPDPTYRRKFGERIIGPFSFFFQPYSGYYPVTYNLDYGAGVITRV